MDCEKLEKLKAKIEHMEELDNGIKRVEKALLNWDKNVTNLSNISISIGASGNSSYRSTVYEPDEFLVSIVKAGFIAQLEELKGKFKKMVIDDGE